MANEQPNLIWIDCEMTGLSLEKDVLVEIAVLVTDSDLNVIGEGVDVVIKASADSQGHILGTFKKTSVNSSNGDAILGIPCLNPNPSLRGRRPWQSRASCLHGSPRRVAPRYDELAKRLRTVWAVDPGLCDDELAKCLLTAWPIAPDLCAAWLLLSQSKNAQFFGQRHHGKKPTSGWR